MFFKKKSKIEQLEAIEGVATIEPKAEPQELISLRERQASGFTEIQPAPQAHYNKVVAGIVNSAKRSGGIQHGHSMAMDSAGCGSFTDGGYGGISGVGAGIQLNWYANQSFIGYEAAGIIAQNWFVLKACLMPAQDAARPGYRMTTNNGDKLPAEVISDFKEIDKRFDIQNQLIEFANMGAVFGIRVGIYKVRSKDKMYYQKPFNPDGVTEGSYEGITQVDPMWITPVLDQDAQANPASGRFYEPTWWQVNGVMYHYSHLCIMRYASPVDILKPSYIYGGIPLPQLIMNRVYAAEQSSNEVPKIIQSKRTFVLKSADMSMMGAKFSQVMKKWAQFVKFKDNQGVQIIGDADEMDLLETTLADLDDVVDRQYAYACAVPGIPATKMMGGQQKSGLSGENGQDDKNYSQVCSNIQMDMSRLLDGHHIRAYKSFIEPNRGEMPHICHEWNVVDTPGEKEKAETEKLRAETASIYFDMGAISSEDVTSTLQADDSRMIIAPDKKVAKEIDFDKYEKNIESDNSDDVNGLAV